MKCYLHTGRDSSGYCTSCGNFYCERCLMLCEDGKNYCQTCRGKLGIRIKPETGAIDGQLATKLLVKLKTGKSLLGTTYKIDPDRPHFNITPYSEKGGKEEKEIAFSDVRYVALVRSLTGEKRTGTAEYRPKGSEVSISFHDGEIIRGFTLKAYSDKDPRFSVIPEDPKDNRISIIVERTAVANMILGRIPRTQELRALADNSVKRLILHYYWQHPDIVVSIDDLAARLERTATVVERELEEFYREGIVKLLDPNGRQLKFVPAKDTVVRQAINAMAKDIEMLYFRKKTAVTETAGGAPSRPVKPTPQWPLS